MREPVDETRGMVFCDSSLNLIVKNPPEDLTEYIIE